MDNYVSVTLQPGRIGLKFQPRRGKVTRVFDGQGRKLGISKGWYFYQVDGERYVESLLDAKVVGGESYEAIFLVPRHKTPLQHAAQECAASVATVEDACASSLHSTIEMPELVLQIGLFIGLISFQALAASSKRGSLCLQEISPTICLKYAPCFYLFGGGEMDHPLTVVEKLNSVSGSWEQLLPMSVARWCPVVGVISSTIYVCGGGDGVCALRSTERLDLVSGDWSNSAPMHAARFWAAGGMHADALYVCGGEGHDDSEDEDEALGSGECFDSVSGIWTRLPSMLERRGSLSGAFVEGVFYACGGLDEQERTLSSVERFDPLVGLWGAAPSMLAPRASAAAVNVSGKLWVCGGKCGEDQRLSSIERFDPLGGFWEALTPMKFKRGGPAALTLAGSCYIFGGSDGTTALDQSEVYVTAGATWSPSTSLCTPRWGFGAVVFFW